MPRLEEAMTVIDALPRHARPLWELRFSLPPASGSKEGPTSRNFYANKNALGLGLQSDS